MQQRKSNFKGVLLYRDKNCFKKALNKLLFAEGGNYISLPPGGRWHFRKKMTEGASDSFAYHSSKNKQYTFIHAGSYHRYRGPPPGGRLRGGFQY